MRIFRECFESPWCVSFLPATLLVAALQIFGSFRRVFVFSLFISNHIAIPSVHLCVQRASALRPGPSSLIFSCLNWWPANHVQNGVHDPRDVRCSASGERLVPSWRTLTGGRDASLARRSCSQERPRSASI